ncbi:DNA-binding LytR/AlgR family response regulator [Rhizobium sp. BK275]|uniref:LytTR family transcriptional regulator DNA-binding domain-containing protein n=1 Tax=unclassified Rhizobium TaxID=2613769 RepID=UPI00161E24FC|nr:DNA-binding LytR/AlgR family response regulator [Rhizobium sp. BK275]MBB3409419.1 DNA-binding LytR/AlgR family response regulator [Rhizobium sp. BK316]
MDHPSLQSTLRELQLFWRSSRFWGTFLAVVLIFVVTGPYGTMDSMPAGKRLAYWLILHAVAWSIAILFSVLADGLLRKVLNRMFWRMMIGSLIAALPIGFAIGLVDYAFIGDPVSLGSGLYRAVFALPLCALFCFLTYLTMHRQIEQATAEIPPSTSILDRLKPHNRGALLRLSVQDHYTEVVTSRGRELVLLRFSDALREIGATPGLQVHRSHWVADAHVEALKRDNGKILILTRDGTQVPVSRSFAEEARRRFG